MSAAALLPLAIGVLSYMGARKQAKAGQNTAAFEQTAAAQEAVKPPEVVKAPEVDSNSATAKAMEAAAEKEKQAAVARAQKQGSLAQGLGVTGIASLQKSQLLGA